MTETLMIPECGNERQLLTELSREELLKRDVFGRTILHILIMANQPDLLQEVMSNSEVKHILRFTDYENCWNCLHYVMFYKRITCFAVLFNYFRNTSSKQNTLLLSNNNVYVELLKAKDRANTTPFQLIDNDFKNLVWIPEHISNIDVKLSFRYLNPTGTPLDKIPRDRWTSIRAGSEIFVLGSNSSNQFGLGDSTDRSAPVRIPRGNFSTREDFPSVFGKISKPAFKKIAVSKNHSILLDEHGLLYSCGKGSRGRLGHQNLKDSFKFEFVKIDKLVKDFAISNNHCIALTEKNSIYSWGLNSFSQLGYKSTGSTANKMFLETFDSTPTIVGGDLKSLSRVILGVAVSKVHSLAYTELEIFSWGLNIGQMGFSSYEADIDYKVGDSSFKGSIQDAPKVYQVRSQIKMVDTCEDITVIVTSKNEIHVLHRCTYYKLPKIPVKASSEKSFEKFKPSKLTELVTIKKLIVRNSKWCILLLECGDVMSFSFDSNDYKNTRYSYVWKANGRDMHAVDVATCSDGSIILCTMSGAVFLKTLNTSQRTNSFSEISNLNTNKNKFKKVEGLNKIIQVTADLNFTSFAFIRDDIDTLPILLKNNDFINDVSSLADIQFPDHFRKQNELFSDNKTSSYTAKFLPKDHLDSDTSLLSETVSDRLVVKYYNRFMCSTDDEFSKVFDLELQEILSNLRDNLSVCSRRLFEERENSDFDCFITIKSHPGFKMGIHKAIFSIRSRAFQKLFDPKESNDLFVSGNIRAIYDKNLGILTFERPVHYLSVAIFVYFVYSGEILLSKKGFELGGMEKKAIDDIAREVETLRFTFGIHDYHMRHRNPLQQFSSLLEGNGGNVTIKLSDGELVCHSYILRARCAFFETSLSGRWDSDEKKVVTFERHNVSSFYRVLLYIYGLDMDTVFNIDVDDDVEFINRVLELIDIADELLLFQLKDLCQVAISSFISVDNAVPLITECSELSANKLFINCAWYIYNNLELLIMNSGLFELPVEVSKKLDKWLSFIHSCHFLDREERRVWPEDNFNEILQTWLRGDFNEYFMSDRKGYASFEPLIDLKSSEKQPLKEKRKKKNSRRSSTLSSGILDFRNSIQARKQDSSENAIDDTESGFELVTKGKRKSKAKVVVASSSTPISIPASISALSSLVVNLVNLLLSLILPTSASVTSQKNKVESAVGGLSPFSNWASTSLEAPPSTTKPTLSSSTKKQKAKLGPIVKLSQKERKRLMLESASTDPKVVPELPPVNPWKTASPQNEPNVPAKDDTKDLHLPPLGHKNNTLPMLGSSKDQKSPLGSRTQKLTICKEPRTSSVSNYLSQVSLKPIAMPILGTYKGQGYRSAGSSAALSSSSSTSSLNYSYADTTNSFTRKNEYMNSSPSLSDIMLEESLKIEEARLQEAERKSLAEIQQEQEFARWWEEEASRVQRQMALSQSQETSKKKGNLKRNKAHKRKQEGRENHQALIN